MNPGDFQPTNPLMNLPSSYITKIARNSFDATVLALQLQSCENMMQSIAALTSSSTCLMQRDAITSLKSQPFFEYVMFSAPMVEHLRQSTGAAAVADLLATQEAGPKQVSEHFLAVQGFPVMSLSQC